MVCDDTGKCYKTPIPRCYDETGKACVDPNPAPPPVCYDETGRVCVDTTTVAVVAVPPDRELPATGGGLDVTLFALSFVLMGVGHALRRVARRQ